MKSQITTIETVQNLKNVNYISHVDSKNFVFYSVTFYNGDKITYAVKH